MSSSVLHLIDAPFKDFVLVANDGKEIQVHKCVVSSQSKVIEAILINTNMKVEDRYETGCSYDALICVVLWMYGVSPISEKNYGNIDSSDVKFVHDRQYITKWHELYVVADKLGVVELLDWKMYININPIYISRFSKLEDGTETPLYIEEVNYETIYNEIITSMALNKCNAPIIYFGDILEKLSERMIVDWVTHKTRMTDEHILIDYAMKSEKLCRILVPLINYSCIYSRGYLNNDDKCIIGKWLRANGKEIPAIPMVPITYRQMLCLRSSTGYIDYNSKYEDVKNIKVHYNGNMQGSVPLHELISEEDYINLKDSDKLNSYLI